MAVVADSRSELKGTIRVSDYFAYDKILKVPETGDRLEYFEIPHPSISEVLVFRTHADAALALALRQREIAHANPGRIIRWPTGNTQKPVYEYHRKLAMITGDNPLARLRHRQVDEYYPCNPITDAHSFTRYLQFYLEKPLGLSFDFIRSWTKNPKKEIRRYTAVSPAEETALVTGGTDFHEGHFGFIHPGTPFNDPSRQGYHYAPLSESTKSRDLRRGQTPKEGAITMGYDFLHADHVILIAPGARGDIVRRALFERTQPDAQIPISSLLGIGGVTSVYLDADAALYILQPEMAVSLIPLHEAV